MGLDLNRPAESTSRSDTRASTALSGRQLFLAQTGWLVVVVLTLGLFFASIPAHYDWLVNFTDPEDLEPALVRANLEAAGFSIDFYATYLLFISVASTLIWGMVSIVIFWGRSDDRMALFTSLALLTFGAFTRNDGPIALAAQYSALSLPVHLLAFFGSVSFLLFFYLFPNGRFVPRWTRWMAILWIAHEVPYYFFPDSSFNIDRSLPLADFVVFLIFVFVAVGAQLYRYRRVSSPVQRQQTKWVVFGTVAAGLGTVGFSLPLYVPSTLAQFGPTLVQFGTLAIQAGISGSWLLVPLSIGLAVLRHRLWDIDIIINRTLVYGGLTVSLASVYFGGVTALQYLFILLTGQGNTLAIVASTLAIAALFNPLRRRIQGFIDRSFYRRKYDAAKTLEAFGNRLRDETDLEKISEDLGEVVDETMQPSHMSLWLKFPSSSPKRSESSSEVRSSKHSAPPPP